MPAIILGCAAGTTDAARSVGGAARNVIQGDYKIGGFAVKADSTLSGAIAEFGLPTQRRRMKTTCRVVWKALGITAVFYKIGLRVNACDPSVGVFFRATMTGHGWHTANGLKVGASAARIRQVFPRATFHRGRIVGGWWLVVRYYAAPSPGLLAKMRRGRVAAFVVTYPAGGI